MACIALEYAMAELSDVVYEQLYPLLDDPSLCVHKRISLATFLRTMLRDALDLVRDDEDA